MLKRSIVVVKFLLIINFSTYAFASETEGENNITPVGIYSISLEGKSDVIPLNQKYIFIEENGKSRKVDVELRQQKYCYITRNCDNMQKRDCYQFSLAIMKSDHHFQFTFYSQGSFCQGHDFKLFSTSEGDNYLLGLFSNYLCIIPLVKSNSELIGFFNHVSEMNRLFEKHPGHTFSLRNYLGISVMPIGIRLSKLFSNDEIRSQNPHYVNELEVMEFNIDKQGFIKMMAKNTTNKMIFTIQGKDTDWKVLKREKYDTSQISPD